MSRRVRVSDISLPAVLAAELAALLTHRWLVAGALLSAVVVAALIGRLIRRDRRAHETELRGSAGRPALVYFHSPL